MRIAILNMTGGGISSGYRKYLRNVIPRMIANSAVEGIFCACPASANMKKAFRQLQGVTFVNCKPYGLFGYRNDSQLNYHLKQFSPDVLFIPTERFFKFNNIPTVNMVQNMEPFVSRINGNPIGERFKNLVRRIDGKRSIRKANHVIAISNFVYDFLIKNWKVQPKRIALIYHGIGMPESKRINRPHIIPEGWKNQFLFTAGSIRPARGLEDLLQAVKYLSDKSQEIPPIVIAGKTSPGMIKYRKKLEGWNKAHKQLCWTGYLNEKEMAWCYQNCSAFVMTSRVEACPNIALEAMSYGCVCICADNPPMPEFFADAAIFYTTKHGESLGKAIQSVVVWKDNRRRKMSNQARKRAAEFSWDVCAEKTVAVLAKAVEDKQSEKL